MSDYNLRDIVERAPHLLESGTTPMRLHLDGGVAFIGFNDCGFNGVYVKDGSMQRISGTSKRASFAAGQLGVQLEDGSRYHLLHTHGARWKALSLRGIGLPVIASEATVERALGELEDAYPMGRVPSSEYKDLPSDTHPTFVYAGIDQLCDVERDMLARKRA